MAALRPSPSLSKLPDRRSSFLTNKKLELIWNASVLCNYKTAHMCLSFCYLLSSRGFRVLPHIYAVDETINYHTSFGKQHTSKLISEQYFYNSQTTHVVFIIITKPRESITLIFSWTIICIFGSFVATTISI